MPAIGLLALLTLVLVSAPATAQTAPSANPVSDAVREVLVQQSKNLTASADLLPADKYTFRPTPAQMTFGDLMKHVAETNTIICSLIGGLPLEQPPALDSGSKDPLVTAVKKSFDLCTSVLAKVGDSQLGEQLTMGGRTVGTRAMAMITIATDWADHYSTAASYLRLNGVLPPTAQPRQK